jgi:hypothetical protein
MSHAAVPASREPAREPSDRVRLARAALSAALAAPKVVRGDAGPDPQRVTVDAGERLVGVLAIAEPDGRYEIELRLVAELVPLHALAEEVRVRVRRAAAHAGLDALLGEVNIEFGGLLTAEERAAVARAFAAQARAAPAGAAPAGAAPADGDRLAPDGRGAKR